MNTLEELKKAKVKDPIGKTVVEMKHTGGGRLLLLFSDNTYMALSGEADWDDSVSVGVDHYFQPLEANDQAFVSIGVSAETMAQFRKEKWEALKSKQLLEKREQYERLKKEFEPNL